MIVLEIIAYILVCTPLILGIVMLIVGFSLDVRWKRIKKAGEHVKDYCRQTSEKPSLNSMSYESAVSYFTLRWYSEDHIYSGYYEFLMDEDANLLGGVDATPYYASGRFIPQDSEEYAYIVAKGREAYDYAIEQKGGN